MDFQARMATYNKAPQYSNDHERLHLILLGIEELVKGQRYMATAAQVQAALDTESNAIAAVEADLTRIAADITAANTGNNPALDALVTEIQGHVTSLTTSQAAIDAVDPTAITPAA